MEARAEAVAACRLWAVARWRLLGHVWVERQYTNESCARCNVSRNEQNEQMLCTELGDIAPEFDAQMFRLGDKVFTAEGEVTNVERLG